MDTHAGRLLFAALGAIFIFYVVVTDMSFKYDQTNIPNINTCVQEFVDKSVVTGKINKSNMQDMYDALYRTGYIYDVQITHKSLYEYPKDDGDYTSHFDAYSKEYILENVDTDGNYKMKDGDNLTVSIKTKSPTLSERAIGSITGRGFAPIMYTYSKDVGNTLR